MTSQLAEIASRILFSFDRLEQRLKVPSAEPFISCSLDDLDEHRGAF